MACLSTPQQLAGCSTSEHTETLTLKYLTPGLEPAAYAQPQQKPKQAHSYENPKQAHNFQRQTDNKEDSNTSKRWTWRAQCHFELAYPFNCAGLVSVCLKSVPYTGYQEACLRGFRRCSRQAILGSVENFLAITALNPHKTLLKPKHWGLL